MGYQSTFLGRGQLTVRWPELSKEKKNDIAPVKDHKRGILNYPRHSVQLSKKRKFPLITAVNINGAEFKNLTRESLFAGKERWTIDERAVEYQWGDKLYQTPNSHFDKGHLVKREDPQWGADEQQALEAAKATFFYTNCAPQVAELNQRVWRGLEDYILKKQATKHKLRVTVFTGPVLAEDDPIFADKVNGEEVRIPHLFWKVVYFTHDNQTLNRVAFLMGQSELLEDKGIVKPWAVGKGGEPLPMPKLFADYKDAATYQVNVEFIEELTGIHFAKAYDPYKDHRPKEIVMKQVSVSKESARKKGAKTESDSDDFELEGIVLG